MRLTIAGAGLVPDRYDAEKVGTEWLSRPLFYRRIDDALEFHNGRTQLVVDRYSDAIAKWLKDIGRERDDKNARSKKTLGTFTAIEYVVPGTRLFLNGSVDTSRAGLSALGLLIHALCRLANRQGIGGWVRNGFGQFETSLFLVTQDGTRLPILVNQDGKYTPNTGAEPVIEALDAWAEAEIKIMSGELEKLYSLSKETAEVA